MIHIADWSGHGTHYHVALASRSVMTKKRVNRLLVAEGLSESIHAALIRVPIHDRSYCDRGWTRIDFPVGVYKRNSFQVVADGQENKGIAMMAKSVLVVDGGHQPKIAC